jgi:hypothetical protein
MILRVVPAPVTVTPDVVCIFVGAVLGKASTVATANTNTISEAIAFANSELFSLLLYFIVIY